MMGSDRTWPLTTIIALIGFIFVPAVLTVLGIGGSETPETEIENLPDGVASAEESASDTPSPAAPARSIRGIEDWFTERVPGRELAFEFERSTTRIVDDNYTGAVAANERVNMGEDGWLFITDATDQPCVSPEQEAQWNAEIDRVEALLTDAGKQVVIAIAPDRAIMAPELLGDIPNECERTNTEVIDRLAERTSVIDLGTAVTGPEHALQLDTHWSPAGAMAGAELIVEAIEPGVWEKRGLTSEVLDRPGDLDGLLGYDNTETVNLLTIEQPEPTALEPFETSLPGRPLVQATTPGAVERNVLVIHDSFGGYAAQDDPTRYQSGAGIHYLRPWFESVDNVRLAGRDALSIADAPVARSLADADVVVFLVVQRTLPVRFGPGMLSDPLAASLAG